MIVRFWERGSLALLAIACCGCGYIGDALPPALNLPNRVTDLTALQRGARIYIQFTMSRMTTEAMPIQTAPDVDVRVGPSGPVFNQPEWLLHARQLPATSGQTKFDASTADFEGKDVVIGVRLLNDRGKTAGWSNFVTLPVTPPVGRPEHVTAIATEKGVALEWRASGAPQFRVFRKSAAAALASVGETSQSRFVDPTAEFGTAYEYTVQGILKVGDKTSESDLSETIPITPLDVFPPGAPANVKVISGPRTIEVSWDRNTESDLAYYRVYRAAGEAEFVRVADKVSAPSYSDHAISPGVRYRYVVTALDQGEHESARSEVTEAVPQ